MHDALMVELPLESWREDLVLVRSVMEEVGKVATGGLEVRTDAQVMMPGERLLCEADSEWRRWQRVVQATAKNPLNYQDASVPYLSTYKKEEEGSQSGSQSFGWTPPAERLEVGL
jgi:hypothetical protein